MTVSTALDRRVMRDRVVQILVSAESLLKQAQTVQQAKAISDLSAAQEVFAKRQQLGRELEDRAFALKIAALSRLGELIAAQKATVGLNKGTRGQLKGRDASGGSKRVPPEDASPTLADAGLDKKVSMIAQELARLPADQRERIARREVKLTEARRQQRRAEQPPTIDLPDGVFRVVYADPPWSYGNRGAIGDTDNYGHAERHYPAMTIPDLCALDVQARVAADAVLFLWVTSPLLAECWPVIKAWGFTYKASIIWDKERHNFGHYVSVRHELLLIATRGSCLPDCPTPMPDSVISIPRSDRHSEKPAEFRALIDRLYPRGPALELFSRWEPPVKSRWVAHGNERLAIA